MKSNEELPPSTRDRDWRLLPNKLDDDDTWAAERIVDSRKVRGCTLYLVKWAGWSEEHNSWEPKDHCSARLIAEFNERA